MSAVAGYFERIQDQEVAHRYDVDYKLIEKVAATINQVLSTMEPLPVGYVERTFLTQAEFFVARNSTDWMLCNGQSCVGTAYGTLTGNTTVPNAQARFFRMKDYGSGHASGGDVAIGTDVGDTYKTHSHAVSVTTDAMAVANPAIDQSVGGSATARCIVPQTFAHVLSVSPQNNVPGGTESRPENMTVNFFIKVN
jgi:hypothetical protein